MSNCSFTPDGQLGMKRETRVAIAQIAALFAFCFATAHFRRYVG
jgi:hypothetical protein